MTTSQNNLQTDLTHNKGAFNDMNCQTEPRKPYNQPSIIYETVLHTSAGSQAFPDPYTELDPSMPGKPANSRSEDTSLNPPMPPKPPARSSSDDGGTSLNPPMPPKP
jgi:hypothetical protein